MILCRLVTLREHGMLLVRLSICLLRWEVIICSRARIALVGISWHEEARVIPGLRVRIQREVVVGCHDGLLVFGKRGHR